MVKWHMLSRKIVVFCTLKFSRASLSINKKMASTELLRRLETRAVTAEQIVVSLKHEVEEIKTMIVQQNNQSKVQQLEVENEQLRTEIEEWKNKLIQLEVASGIEQIPLPRKKTTLPAEGNKTTLPVEPTKTIKVETAKPTTPIDTGENKVQKVAKKKEKSAEPKKAKSGEESGGTAEEPPVDVGRLDLRVGRIVTVKKHPDADSLYVEEVDVGEENPRTVVSGLVKHVSVEEMQNRLVVLLCNLKPAKMRGVTSEAMVMCASSPDKVEILIPPSGSVPGDQIHVEGFPRVPDTVLNPKKKIFETVAPDLKTNLEKVATYKGVAFSVPGKGVVTAPSLVGVNIK